MKNIELLEKPKSGKPFACKSHAPSTLNVLTLGFLKRI